MGKIHNKPQLHNNRKQLRNYSTTAEATLWRFLKHSQLEGRKFRRQHSVNNYILDFYCPEENLAIELDGAGHFTSAGTANDIERDKELAAHNIRVLHFENKWIFQNPDGVLEEIKRHFKQ